MWYNRLRKGQEDVNGDARPCRASNSRTDENIEPVKKMILDNSRITIRDVADNICISFNSRQAYFTYVLGMKHTAAKIVLKLLHFEQKQRRMDISQEMFMMFDDDLDLLKTLITADESRVCGYENDVIVEKAIINFCTSTAHVLADRCLCVSFWSRAKP